MPNDINGLRERMFRAMDMLESGDMDLEYAKAMCLCGQVIINATKVEMDFTKNVAGLGTNFIPISPEERRILNKRFQDNIGESDEPKQLNK